jgi:hypothetical protein
MENSPERFPFAFASSYRLPALAFGITPRTSWVKVSADRLSVRFGLWSLSTPLTNVREASLTGDFAWWRTAGPAHLSLADRGVTFATNGDRAVCVTFHEPVKVIDPTGRLLRHPGATMTVADVDRLHAVLQQGSAGRGT